MGILITIHDFLNYTISGLDIVEIRKIQAITGVREKGCFMMASYKSGAWDGRSAYINDDGVGMVRNLPDVLDAMERIRTIDLDTMEFNDLREPKLLRLPEITEDWLKKETGYSLYDYQVNGINSAINMTHDDTGEGGILKLATNSGKCQPLYSNVMTPNGWVAMGELNVGDYVTGSDGSPVLITSVYDGGIKDVYEVSSVRGRKMQSCADHLYPVGDECGVEHILPLSTIMEKTDTKFSINVIKVEDICTIGVDKEEIESITHIGKEPTKCIMIDSDDHLYITDDWILTHNTVVTLGISKAFDGKLKTLVIVPSTNLVEQTYKDYQNSDLRSAMLLSKMSKKKRLETIRNNNHIIMTGSLFLSLHEEFQTEEWVLIYDEVHEFGEKTSLAIRQSLAHCQYRVGLTATMPADKKDMFKDGFIRHHFGDDLAVIEQDELIKRGISSTIMIDCITIQTPLDNMSHADKAWDWDREMAYYNTNAIRFEGIIEEVRNECGGNTLVLCQPTLGHAAAEEIGAHFVDKDVPTDIRSGWYSEFENATDYVLFASFGCASTGLSINNIQTLILIEIGKDRTRIMQSIGRGLRLDGDTNSIRVVDISSGSKYACQHRKEREKIYKEEGFDFKLIRIHEAT